MAEKEFELTEETLQKYYDQELGETARSEVEARLGRQPEALRLLREYKRLSELLEVVARQSEPDQLRAQRNWEAIARRLKKAQARTYRRAAGWLSIAAAAILFLFIYAPFSESADNELVIESIDCSYASFMVLNLEQENGHTIIWINDSGTPAGRMN